MKTKLERITDLSENILGALYDPQEVVGQTNKQVIQEWITVTKMIGYNNVAKIFENAFDKKSTKHIRLNPDEIRMGFTKKMIEYYSNKELPDLK